MFSVLSKKLAFLALAGLALSPAAFADDYHIDIHGKAERKNARSVAIEGDADLAGWASKAIDAHGAFDVKPGAALKIRFTKSGPNTIAVSFSGSETWSATASGADVMSALWAAVDAAIVEAGRKYAVKPLFAQTKLAFVRGGAGDIGEIYVGDLMLPSARALTGHGKHSQSPHWAPDGGAVYYTSWFSSGGADVFRVDLGGRVTKIASYKGTNTGGAVSPDGTRIALALSPKGTSDIYVASASGAGAHAIVATDDVEMSPCWSPDGTRIAYTGGVSGRPQIMIVPAAGGATRRVSTGGYSSEPAWNPVKPTQIAFTLGDHAGIGVADISAGVSSVPLKSPRPVSHPTWCADGRHVAVTIGKDGHFQIGLLDTESGKLSVLSGPQFGSCFDPDARIAR